MAWTSQQACWYKKKGQIQFYLLVQLLHEEAEYVELHVSMVHQETLARYQRKEYWELNSKPFNLWGQFNSGEIGEKQLLRSCGKLYRPSFKKGQENHTSADALTQLQRTYSQKSPGCFKIYQ